MLRRSFLLVLLLAPMSAWAASVLVLGDSLSAGHGIDVRQGWVQRLQQRLKQEGYPYRVVNASISGDTSAGALARLPRALETFHPRVLIVEIGGNDGLQGLSLAQLEDNLQAIVRQGKRAGARILVLGVRIPPNYGPQYTGRFHAIYGEIAKRNHVALVPFFLEGVAGHAELMQTDGVHPRDEAQQRLMENVWKGLKPLLKN
ncbi:MAG: arylesterase [Acidiferrobacteraceae bacterium]|jgi:acyl-CoA thioesterase-1